MVVSVFPLQEKRIKISDLKKKMGFGIFSSRFSQSKIKVKCTLLKYDQSRLVDENTVLKFIFICYFCIYF